MKKYKWGKSSLNRLEGVHPKLVQFAKLLLLYSEYDLGISEGVRTLETQQSYYAKGRTKPGKIITNCDGVKSKSWHQVQTDGYGHAIDIFCYDVSGKGTNYSNEYMDYIGKLGKMISYTYFGGTIRWGGDFKNLVDKPHWEYRPDKTPLQSSDFKI